MKFNIIAKRIAAAGLAAGLVLTTSVVSMAANYDPQAEGTSCTFKKYLIMDAGDTVPNATFSFSVEPGQPVSASTAENNAFQVLSGVGTPTIANVVFSPSDTTSAKTAAAETEIDIKREASDRADGLTALTGVQFETGEKFVVKSATVSFTGIKFDEPGIYRYIIKETPASISGIMQDNDTDRVLDVYVIDNNGRLEVAEYVLHKKANAPAINTTMGSADVASDRVALGDKTDGFTNEYNSKDLAFKKEVTGNQASRDKYFKFTAKVTGLTAADEFVVSLAADNDSSTTDGNADASPVKNSATIYGTMSNPTTVTGAQLNTGVEFYLQHGQSIAIRGLAPNATYTVSEVAEDYKSIEKGVSGYEKNVTGVLGEIAGTDKAVMTSFKNERTGVVPTGVILDSAPFIIIIGLAVAALAFTALRKKSR